MKTRRSIRKFKDLPVPESILEEIIEMAMTAPSASNKQPWRFLVCSNTDILRQMASEVQKNIECISNSIPEEMLSTFKNYGNYFVRFANAPVLIVPIYRSIKILSHLIAGNASEPQNKIIKNMEEKSAVVSTSLAIQNLMLYAHNTGLGTSCLTGPLLAENDIKKILKIPKGWDIPCLIAIGYADEEPQTPGRKDFKKLIKWIR